MSVLAGICCGFLLNLFHVLFSFYLQLKLFKFVFLKYLYNINNLYCNKFKKFQLESELIEKCVKNYSKLPRHMTLILGEESVSYEDLIQIIVWTLPTGIPVLSFYDHKNELKADTLYEVFLKNYKELVPHIKWGVSFSKNNTIEKNLSKNVSNRYLQVNILDSKYSRQLLIDSIKELSRKKDLKLTDRASTEAALDDLMMQKLSNSGNPDFVVINGNVYTTYGLSPWHIGFTELLTIPSYKLLTVKDFTNILHVYAGYERKFGR